MPGAFGPILTAGLALSTAAVVVANPVVAPRADVQIPAAQVSKAAAGDDDALAMLDDDFINAIGPTPSASTSPLAVFQDLVGALVANAAYLGKNAILHAFVAGTNVVVLDPELTAASYPLVPIAPSGPGNLPWTAPVAPVVAGGELGPVVTQAVTAIIADVGDLSDVRAVAAAFVAGVAMVAEQRPVLNTLRAVVRGDFGRILDTAVDTVDTVASAVVGQDRARPVIDVIRTVTDLRLPTLEDLTGLPAAPASGSASLNAAAPSLAIEEDGEQTGRQRRQAPAVESAVTLPLPAASELSINTNVPGLDVPDLDDLDVPGPDVPGLDVPKLDVPKLDDSEVSGGGTVPATRRPAESGPLGVADTVGQDQSASSGAGDAPGGSAGRTGKSLTGRAAG